ncbi:MAG: response regulator, partial [Rhodoferax sp.]|nr:response regulator [Rhodoferax sp.]
PQASLPEEDDIEAQDVLDVDLFPIFEEEALELLPQLSAALRQWSAQPGAAAARQQALRVLHTLKGSARLAGAMRLGEMAHRMESALEAIDPAQPDAAALDSLLGRLDNISTVFEALRAMPEQALVLPERTPVLADIAEDTLAEALTAAVPAARPEPSVSLALAPASSVASMAPVLPLRRAGGQTIRIRSQLLDRMVNQAGEVMITRSRLESRLGQLRGSLDELTSNLDRLRHQLRDVELQSESQMQSRLAQAKDSDQGFDPLEFDRFTRVQELTRMMAESVHDVATLQRNLQQTVAGVEDDLIAQARQTRELQRDLLRTRMVEFDSISERLYGVVRQAAKDANKSVKLDLEGGSLEIDRGVLDRVTPAFEHLLRNAVGHGIESAAARVAAGKPAQGEIVVSLTQQSNDVTVTFRDDGAGLDLARIHAKAQAQGLVTEGAHLTDEQVANLIFSSGLSTASETTELSGRGIGMDVVRNEVNALGGRIELSTQPGQGTEFKLMLPLTTAVTQVVLLRLGDVVMGVPASLVELVRRVPQAELKAAYTSGEFNYNSDALAFYWAGALLQTSQVSAEPEAKTASVAIFRSAGRRVAWHVDEVLGNQEVVVKNLGPQLSRLPGLAGMSVLASGAVVLMYNPVALSATYGEQARAFSARTAEPAAAEQAGQGSARHTPGAANQLPLVLVVDDSITVRRVTQRLLKREGFRVSLASDGLQALEVLQVEKPAVVLTDIEMPRMDGFDLVRNIRGDAHLKDLPIIMITSRIAEKHREYARELKVDHYLGKPYPEDELIGLVRGYCEVENLMAN